MSHSSDRSTPPDASIATADAAALSPTAPGTIATAPRHFTLLYEPSAGVTLQRDIAGALTEALAVACGMLHDGSAKHVDRIETRRIDGVVPHSRIVRCCAGQPEAS